MKIPSVFATKGPPVRVSIALSVIAVTMLAAAPTFAAVVDIEVAPPAARVVPAPAPRPGFIWAPGYYRWDGHRHVWVDGRWMRERRGFHWVPERWEERRGHYHFEDGHWDRD